jgi:hypothetical protein
MLLIVLELKGLVVDFVQVGVEDNFGAKADTIDEGYRVETDHRILLSVKSIFYTPQKEPIGSFFDP